MKREKQERRGSFSWGSLKGLSKKKNRPPLDA
jgi:hypothetical protein